MVIEVAALALNEVVVLPEATVTAAGTLRELLFDVRFTTVPPEGAAWLRTIVQELACPPDKLTGLHEIVDIDGGRGEAARLTVAAFELLPRAAVTVAL